MKGLGSLNVAVAVPRGNVNCVKGATAGLEDSCYSHLDREMMEVGQDELALVDWDISRMSIVR